MLMWIFKSLYKLIHSVEVLLIVMCLVGLGDMSKDSYLCISSLICGIRYLGIFYSFVFGLNT